jgi:hypothetical protein
VDNLQGEKIWQGRVTQGQLVLPKEAANPLAFLQFH